jgi:hypothetical protein
MVVPLEYGVTCGTTVRLLYVTNEYEMAVAKAKPEPGDGQLDGVDENPAGAVGTKRAGSVIGISTNERAVRYSVGRGDVSTHVDGILLKQGVCMLLP